MANGSDFVQQSQSGEVRLDFFVSAKMGRLEKIEDIDHLRFIENGKILKFRPVSSESISVDTKNDLEKVRSLMKEALQRKNI